jgi:hypothetical protein
MTAIHQLTAALDPANDPIAARLALADYLEERGDSLGEALRLACERERYAATARGYNSVERQYIANVIQDKNDRIAELRPIVLAPALAAVDAAWPRCVQCDGLGEVERETGPGDIVQPDACYKCNGTGRIGKPSGLWRDCPECGGKKGKPIARFGTSKLWEDCTRCDGVGVLLESPCQHCANGLSERETCPACLDEKYIPSPLHALWQLASLLWMPEAEGLRRGDAATVLRMLSDTPQQPKERL